MQQSAIRSLLGRVPIAALIPNRGLLYLHGSQASEFLNGVLASTVPHSKGHFFSCFLQAQGRVLYDVFVYAKKDYKGQDGYLIEYDSRASEAPPILPFLKRYILRSKVKIEDVSDAYDVWAAWNSEVLDKWETKRQWNWSRSGAVEPVWDSNGEWPWGTEENVLRDRRAVGMGRRLLVPKGDRPRDVADHEIGNSDSYTIHRIMHGVPEGIVDIPPMQAFPMESNLDIMGGLDFRKGCYVGQELTVRTYHTGVVRKRILPIQILDTKETRSSLEGGQYIHPSSRILAIPKGPKLESDTPQPKSRTRSSNKLLSTVNNMALALLRLDHLEGVEKGELSLCIETEENNEQSRAVAHRWPEWWPRQSFDQ